VGFSDWGLGNADGGFKNLAPAIPKRKADLKTLRPQSPRERRILKPCARNPQEKGGF
jgi:hypothetical protein